jgi:hypothetical protein
MAGVTETRRRGLGLNKGISACFHHIASVREGFQAEPECSAATATRDATGTRLTDERQWQPHV